MNFVLFFPDEMRASALSCYGHPVSATSNYQRLASEGTCFQNHYVQNPVCVGSRCSLLTGWYPHVNGYRSLLHFIDECHPNFLKELKDAGYNVQYYGKNHVLTDAALEQSVTRYIGNQFTWRKDDPVANEAMAEMFSGNYTMLYPAMSENLEEMFDTRMVNHGVEFLNSYKKCDDPFILTVAINNPHAPYKIPEPYYSMYDPEELPPLRRKDLANKPGFMRVIREYSGFDTVDDATFRKCAAVYLGMVRYCDDMLGRLLDALDRNGLSEDTMVITTSDHGDWAGDYGLVEKWPNAFDDDLAKVPLVIRVPGGIPGHNVKALVSQIDIFPTILDFAGVKASHDHFGNSLREMLAGGSGDPDAAVYCEGGYDIREQQCFEGTERDYSFLMRKECHYYPKMIIQQEAQDHVCRGTMMRKGDWKIILRTNGEHELYQLAKDPNEEDNLYGQNEYEMITAQLEKEFLLWYIKTSDVVPHFIENR